MTHASHFVRYILIRRVDVRKPEKKKSLSLDRKYKNNPKPRRRSIEATRAAWKFLPGNVFLGSGLLMEQNLLKEVFPFSETFSLCLLKFKKGDAPNLEYLGVTIF